VQWNRSRLCRLGEWKFVKVCVKVTLKSCFLLKLVFFHFLFFFPFLLIFLVLMASGKVEICCVPQRRGDWLPWGRGLASESMAVIFIIKVNAVLTSKSVAAFVSLLFRGGVC